MIQGMQKYKTVRLSRSKPLLPEVMDLRSKLSAHTELNKPFRVEMRFGGNQKYCFERVIRVDWSYGYDDTYIVIISTKRAGNVITCKLYQNVSYLKALEYGNVLPINRHSILVKDKENEFTKATSYNENEGLFSYISVILLE